MKLKASEKRMISARMRAAGIPVPALDHSAITPDLVIECLKGSRAFALKMGSEFLINARISNNSYATLKLNNIRGYLLDVDWDLIFQGDPRIHVPERKTYRMLSGRCVRYNSVLNHRLGDEIAPGTSIEGKLLALSVTGNIPAKYGHGVSVPLELVVTDHYGRQHPSIIEVLVDRSATMPKPGVFSRVGRGLYDGSPRAPEFQYRALSESSVTMPDPPPQGQPECITQLIEMLKKPGLVTMLPEDTIDDGRTEL